MIQNDEKWKPVPGLTNYEFSSHGRARIARPWHRHNQFRGKLLKPQKFAKGGYYGYFMTIDGSHRSRSCSKLLSELFPGIKITFDSGWFDNTVIKNRIENEKNKPATPDKNLESKSVYKKPKTKCHTCKKESYGNYWCDSCREQMRKGDDYLWCEPGEEYATGVRYE